MQLPTLAEVLCLGKGPWCKGLKWQFLENQRFCLSRISQWSWTVIGIQTPEYRLIRDFPMIPHYLSTQKTGHPSWKPLLEWFRCIGPKGRAFFNLENLFLTRLLYYCFNWLIHRNWLIMDNNTYVRLDAVAGMFWYLLVLCSKMYLKWTGLQMCDSFVEAKHVFCEFPPMKTA